MLCRMKRTAALSASTFTLYVDGAGQRIPVTVTRKRVRNLNLRVRGDGSVAMSIPARTSVATAQEFLDRKSAWIVERVRRRREVISAPLHPEELETVMLWGAPVPTERALDDAGIHHDAAARPSTFRAMLQDGPSVPARMSPDEYGRLVDKLYRREIERALPEVVERVEATMGVHASSWSIRSMKTRWGSCTPATRAIRINARLAAYPPLCLEMVVTHELVHLIEPSHNARFHALLDTYCPRNREASALLRRS